MIDNDIKLPPLPEGAVAHLISAQTAEIEALRAASPLRGQDELGQLVMTHVAALFVQPDGCYVGLPGVDAWPEQRDARKYRGPWPVVAHPPCQLWGPFAPINYKRWGGEHNRPGNDGGCFASALASVRKFGGVLEHPAKTRAWAAHGLTKPVGIGWQRCIDGGWVCEVWQSAYGHRANKATWLYYHGTTPPFELRWERPEGTHQIGFYDQRGKARNKPTLGKREANATPIEFRDALIALARHAAGGLLRDLGGGLRGMGQKASITHD
jgi:hypothetical protein